MIGQTLYLIIEGCHDEQDPHSILSTIAHAKVVAYNECYQDHEQYTVYKMYLDCYHRPYEKVGIMYWDQATKEVIWEPEHIIDNV